MEKLDSSSLADNDKWIVRVRYGVCKGKHFHVKTDNMVLAITRNQAKMQAKGKQKAQKRPAAFTAPASQKKGAKVGTSATAPEAPTEVGAKVGAKKRPAALNAPAPPKEGTEEEASQKEAPIEAPASQKEAPLADAAVLETEPPADASGGFHRTGKPLAASTAPAPPKKAAKVDGPLHGTTHEWDHKLYKAKKIEFVADFLQNNIVDGQMSKDAVSSANLQACT